MLAAFEAMEAEVPPKTFNFWHVVHTAEWVAEMYELRGDTDRLEEWKAKIEALRGNEAQSQ